MVKFKKITVLNSKNDFEKYCAVTVKGIPEKAQDLQFLGFKGT